MLVFIVSARFSCEIATGFTLPARHKDSNAS